MTICKITCPHCTTDHQVEFSILNTDSVLECNICSNEFSLNNSSEAKEPLSKVRPKKSFRNTKRNLNPNTTGRHRRVSAPRQAPSKSDHTKLIVNLSVYGLGFILVGVLALKIFGTGPEDKTRTRVDTEQSAKNAYSQSLKSEIAQLRKEIKESKKGAVTETETATSGLVKHKDISSLNVQESKVEDKAGSTVEVVSPPFAAEPKSVESEEENIVYVGFESDKGSSESVDENGEGPVYVTVQTAKANKRIILIESEQSELNELSKLEYQEMTDEEILRLKELKNKYLWYKANRYKMSREDLDEKWEKRWGAIAASNSMVKSRSDALLPRPLQILLADAKNQKDRVYLMRIYQKPVSFEEKERVRRARNQAIWEKRKKDGPAYFKEDKDKKRNEKYIDDFGYEYYLNDRGQRVYL